ncbi:SDR family NAD(P)-dependent oxidoreductase [Alterinioella nitratireducens]|uniref:SDR family NAD(P)-dependent oxidoreductase n=1 Tax=Alterinioella nitratireducens TaxID=2735915 RepID=UPI00155286F0|nr:SDR family NAD(P)-dependent oxidoreductase [Alterinioella nitratireducens]NPD21481.1 SDR family oxidoreductase [Alterinioella nitratireducens]
MFDFHDKIAVITGAGSGIGRATAAFFHACGARVVLADINAAAVEAAAVDLGDPERSAWSVYDATDPDAAERLVALALARFGRIDQLVIAAGIYERQNVASMSDAQWRRMMAVNLDGAFYVARACARAMLASEAGSGAIVGISSVAGHQGGSFAHAHYGASKGGMLAFVRGLARDLAPAIRVNAIAPGWIDTPMVAETLRGSGEAKLKAIPLRRIGAPREVASVAAFLCSEAASFVTGESVIVAGGAYMG